MGFVPIHLAPDTGRTPTASGIWIILRQNTFAIKRDATGLHLPDGPAPAWLPPATQSLCIGYWHEKPVWTVSIDESPQMTIAPTLEFAPLNTVTEDIDDSQLTLAGMARQLSDWNQSARFCIRCSGALSRITGSWGKRCLQCGTETYPRVDPCVIVLVKRNKEFLLVRKAEWPKGRYSLIAGYAERGESLEECVQREVQEETGIKVTNIRYVGSQSWPFPNQLMAGFITEYADGEIRLQRSELEDAQWFSTFHQPAILPGRRTIARAILDRYALK